MEKIIVLGTGHAVVKKCYNTCFALKHEDEYMLVDAGGGSQILTQLDKMHIPLTSIHHLFVSHEHTDHLLGVIWIIRLIASVPFYKGVLHVYTHEALCQGIQTICEITLGKKLTACFGSKIIFHAVKDGQKETILNHEFTFFDILSTKATQFGFTFKNINGDKIVFCGDEPYNKECYPYVKDASWLLHEAFCLYSQKEKYKPYEKHHSTAKDAGELASLLGAKHLVLWHSEDDNYETKKELYALEAKAVFDGVIHVPCDLEEINLEA